MTIQTLINVIQNISGDGNINYEAYNFADTQAFYGIPPIPLRGLKRITADYTAPRARLFNCLTGSGVHVDNINTSGVIELEFMAGSVSGAAIQVMAETKQPLPIFIIDTKSGGTSTLIAPECRLIATPPWKREASPGVDIYTFSSVRMTKLIGVRLIHE
jgi:hypothetical protein